MLKQLIVILGLTLSLNVLACWHGEGTLGVDGETWKFNQKFDHNKEYIIPMGTFILKMTLKPGKNKLQTLVYVVQERKSKSITDVTEGEEEEIKVGETREIYAKGKEGQPSSIITIKISNI